MKQGLRRDTEELQRNHLAPSSRKTYDTGLRSVARWSAAYRADEQLFPISDMHLAQYVTFMANTVHVSTICGYLTACAKYCAEKGIQWTPIGKRVTVQHALQGARRMRKDCVKPKLAITLQLLQRMHDTMPKHGTPVDRANTHTLWAAIVTAYFGTLRKDNVSQGKVGAKNNLRSLLRSDVILEERRALVRLRSSKTNQFGCAAHLTPLAANDTDMCPVKAMRRHIAQVPAGADDAMFMWLPAHGGRPKPLTHRQLVAGIKNAVERAGLNPAEYSGHSLRRGGATLAYHIGASDSEVKLLGCWKSNAVHQYNEVSVDDRCKLPFRMAEAARRSVYGR